MRQPPYSNDPIGMQPTDPISPMEDMPMRPVARMQAQSPVPETPARFDPEIENVETRQEEARTVRFAIAKLSDFIQWFVLVLEVMLIIRFVLKLIGADPTNVFAGFLFALTDIILYPFLTIIPNPSVRPPYESIELTTLIGMGIYYLIFWAIKRFLLILISEPDEPGNTNAG
ncbi:MAG TPA: YggT family protein [Ktedonobacteraceae bacterium]|nr:YggT family protein [Ktedonobacteraceae bacterium]